MKSPILIIFIILNLLTINLVSATNMYSEDIAKSALVQAQDDTVFANCIDESSCDDFCHFFSNMVGYITYQISSLTTNASKGFNNQDELLYSLILDPPTQPPQA